MRTLRLVNASVVTIHNTLSVVGDVIDPTSNEVISPMQFTAPRFVEAFLEATRTNNTELLEQLTTLENCEVIELQVGEYVKRSFVPCFQDDDTDEFYPLRNPESIPGFLRVVP